MEEFIYNLGGGALQRSTLRRKINREEHAEVPDQFMRWVWAGGRKLKKILQKDVGVHPKALLCSLTPVYFKLELK